MEFNRKQLAKMFTAVELSRLFKAGQMDELFRKCGHVINPSNLLACAGDTSVFGFDVNGKKYVAKVVPKNIRFFKHFGHGHDAKDFKKYINRLDPYFLPVEEILYEDDNLFVYSQRKCKIIESKRINKKIVIDVLRLVQFMLINDILLTDLAPHNLGVDGNRVVVFDYHGLHRLKKNGVIKREDWWRRLVRNLARFIIGLASQHKRAEYSAMMQNCTEGVVKKMETDPEVPAVFTTLVKYLMKEQSHASIETTCAHLEACINQIKLHK
jgi:hypothetical protein